MFSAVRHPGHASRTSSRPSGRRSLSRSSSSTTPSVSVPLPLSPAGAARRAVVGLRNFGNTCYCNAPLQVLFSCRQFCEYFLARLNPRKDVNPFSPYRGRLVEAWVSLLRQIYGSGCGDSDGDSSDDLRSRPEAGHERRSGLRCSRYRQGASLVSHRGSAQADTFARTDSGSRAASRPRGALLGGEGPASSALAGGASRSCLRLLELLRRQHAQFAEFQQCDAHEFLRTLLDGLSAECNRAAWKAGGAHASAAGRDRPSAAVHLADSLEDIKGEDPARTSERFWAVNLARESSVVTDLFAGQLVTRIECEECKQKRHRFDAFLDLSLEFPPSDWPDSQAAALASGGTCRLQDMLKYAFGGELFDRQSLDCPFCGVRCTARVRRSLWRLPSEYLVVHIKRFAWDPRHEEMRRVDTRLKVTQELNMSPYCRFSEHASVKNAVFKLEGVVSQLGTAYSGHYTALAVTGGDRWTYFSDDYVSACEFSPDPRGVYLLVFRRVISLEAGSELANLSHASSLSVRPRDFSRPRRGAGEGGAPGLAAVRPRLSQAQVGRGDSYDARRRRSSSSLESARARHALAASWDAAGPSDGRRLREVLWASAREREGTCGANERRETETREGGDRVREEESARLSLPSRSGRLSKRWSRRASEAEIAYSSSGSPSDSDGLRRRAAGLRHRLTLRWRRERATEEPKREEAFPSDRHPFTDLELGEVGERLSHVSLHLSGGESLSGRALSHAMDAHLSRNGGFCISQGECVNPLHLKVVHASSRSLSDFSDQTTAAAEPAASPFALFPAQSPLNCTASHRLDSSSPAPEGSCSRGGAPSSGDERGSASASTGTSFSSSTASSPSSSPSSARHWLHAKTASDKLAASSQLFRRSCGVLASLAAAKSGAGGRGETCDPGRGPAHSRPVSSPPAAVSAGASGAPGPDGPRGDGARSAVQAQKAKEKGDGTPRFAFYSGRRVRAGRTEDASSASRGGERNNPSTAESEDEDAVEGTSFPSLWRARERGKEPPRRGAASEDARLRAEPETWARQRKTPRKSSARPAGVQDLMSRPTLLTGMRRIARRSNSSGRSGGLSSAQGALKRGDTRDGSGRGDREAEPAEHLTGAKGRGDSIFASELGGASSPLALYPSASSSLGSLTGQYSGAACALARRSLSSLLRGSSSGSPSPFSTSGVVTSSPAASAAAGDRGVAGDVYGQHPGQGEDGDGASEEKRATSQAARRADGDAARKSRSRGPLAALRSAAAVASGAFSRAKAKDEETGRGEAPTKQKCKAKKREGDETAAACQEINGERGGSRMLEGAGRLGEGKEESGHKWDRGRHERNTVENAPLTTLEAPNTGRGGVASAPREPLPVCSRSEGPPGGRAAATTDATSKTASSSHASGAQLATATTAVAETPAREVVVPALCQLSEKSLSPPRITLVTPPVSPQASCPISSVPSPPSPLLEASLARRGSAASTASSPTGAPSACAHCDQSGSGRCPASSACSSCVPGAVSAGVAAPLAPSCLGLVGPLVSLAEKTPGVAREASAGRKREKRREATEAGDTVSRLSSVSLKNASTPVFPICSMPRSRRASVTNASASTASSAAATSVSENPAGPQASVPAFSLDTQADAFSPSTCPHRRTFSPTPRLFQKDASFASPNVSARTSGPSAESTGQFARIGEGRGHCTHRREEKRRNARETSLWSARAVSGLSSFAGVAGESQDGTGREAEQEARENDDTHESEWVGREREEKGLQGDARRRAGRRQEDWKGPEGRDVACARCDEIDASGFWRCSPQSRSPTDSLLHGERRSVSRREATRLLTTDSSGASSSSVSSFGAFPRGSPGRASDWAAAPAGEAEGASGWRLASGSEADALVDREESRQGESEFSCSPMHRRSNSYGALASRLALAEDDLRAEEIRLDERIKALQTSSDPESYLSLFGDRETEKGQCTEAGAATVSDAGRGAASEARLPFSCVARGREDAAASRLSTEGRGFQAEFSHGPSSGETDPVCTRVQGKKKCDQRRRERERAFSRTSVEREDAREGRSLAIGVGEETAETARETTPNLQARDSPLCLGYELGDDRACLEAADEDAEKETARPTAREHDEGEDPKGPERKTREGQNVDREAGSLGEMSSVALLAEERKTILRVPEARLQASVPQPCGEESRVLAGESCPFQEPAGIVESPSVSSSGFCVSPRPPPPHLYFGAASFASAAPLEQRSLRPAEEKGVKETVRSAIDARPSPLLASPFLGAGRLVSTGKKGDTATWGGGEERRRGDSEGNGDRGGKKVSKGTAGAVGVREEPADADDATPRKEGHACEKEHTLEATRSKNEEDACPISLLSSLQRRKEAWDAAPAGDGAGALVSKHGHEENGRERDATTDGQQREDAKEAERGVGPREREEPKNFGGVYAGDVERPGCGSGTVRKSRDTAEKGERLSGRQRPGENTDASLRYRRSSLLLSQAETRREKDWSPRVVPLPVASLAPAPDLCLPLVRSSSNLDASSLSSFSPSSSSFPRRGRVLFPVELGEESDRQPPKSSCSFSRHPDSRLTARVSHSLPSSIAASSLPPEPCPRTPPERVLNACVCPLSLHEAAEATRDRDAHAVGLQAGVEAERKRDGESSKLSCAASHSQRAFKEENERQTGSSVASSSIAALSGERTPGVRGEEERTARAATAEKLRGGFPVFLVRYDDGDKEQPEVRGAERDGASGRRGGFRNASVRHGGRRESAKSGG
ncbi:putative ubiquitin carboxyl-terminal hydrolase [Neospora caninum Liverpool]|uniref:Putative ubiquitin carboxyl-terminal hydrolase n=1 Tax=Neospora caninum (strain Liverpool) TaxID=572307 RepID=F0VK70_NEOCL|nr:putative ubiquitin carboxyl-terminal hydrolase [Neospora caninum Liverpool]CBZ54471.1 putative ubiquitin carboxyl-terminal hydrolase [Neospora caninum Liverpool]|eukprot:XP_003884501.1 putative ubiquitin carboxyl-terminal hydrolase [Neospora caninum Liverpool]